MIPMHLALANVKIDRNTEKPAMSKKLFTNDDTES